MSAHARTRTLGVLVHRWFCVYIFLLDAVSSGILFFLCTGNVFLPPSLSAVLLLWTFLPGNVCAYYSVFMCLWPCFHVLCDSHRSAWHWGLCVNARAWTRFRVNYCLTSIFGLCVIPVCLFSSRDDPTCSRCGSGVLYWMGDGTVYLLSVVLLLLPGEAATKILMITLCLYTVDYG